MESRRINSQQNIKEVRISVARRWALGVVVAACLGLLCHRAEAQNFQGGGFNFNFGGGFQGGFNIGGFNGGGFNFQFGGFQGGGFSQFGGSGFNLGGGQFGGGGFQGGGVSQFGGGQFGGQTGTSFNFGGGQFGGGGFQGGGVNFGGGQFGGGGFGGGSGFGGGGAQAFSASFGSSNGQTGFLIVSSGGSGPGGFGPGSNVLAVDVAAIASCIISAVPVTLSQRELLLHVVRASTGDVNARLFRLRAQAERAPPPDPPPPAVISGKKAAQSLQPSPMEFRSDDGRFTLFASGGYASAHLDWRGVSSGFEADSWTESLGAELRLTDHLVFGLAGTHVDTQGIFETRGSVDAEGFAVAAYLSFTHASFYADLLYSYGNFEEDIHRRTGLGTTSRASPDSENHSVEFNTGYNFHLGALTTGPILGLDYRNGNLESYDEHGDPRASLRYEEQNYDSLITRVGWQASYRIPTRFGAITPQIRAAWERENLNDNEWVTVTLVNSPYRWTAGGGPTPEYSVTARTTSPDKDYANVGGGFLVELGPDFSIILDYQGHVFRHDSIEHFGLITLSLRF